MNPLDIRDVNDVHVWQVSLATTPNQSGTSGCCLSPDEWARAARFHFDRDRSRWVIARHALRTILAGYCRLAPESLRFAMNDYGKPSLLYSGIASSVHFNLSHSRDLALIAVARMDVGIDVEYVDPGFAWQRLALDALSDGEYADLQRSRPHRQTACFYRLWTGKEAYIKALGLGLSASLKAFSVSMTTPSDDGARIVDTGAPDDRAWFLYRVPTRTDYAASLVYPLADTRIRLFRWPADFERDLPATICKSMETENDRPRPGEEIR